jgi:8-amino-7-oxononanoate synthase
MSWFDDDLTDLEARGLYRRRRWIASAQGARVRYRNREFVNFASNDYLNLAGDPRLARAAAWAAQRYGTGAGASPLITGYLPPHRKLERDLARWVGTEAALVLPTGYQANLAAVGTLGQDAVLFSDQLNHASLIDGCRLSRSPVHIYRHADVSHLEELLKREGTSAARRLIVTDSVFSMDGDIAPLPELLKLAKCFDCMLLMDEAHATGVLGEQGRGAIEHCQLDRRVGRAFEAHRNNDASSGTSVGLEDSAHPTKDRGIDADRIAKIGTLSKALGSQGGFIGGSKPLIDWLVNHARPYIFSTALAPPAAAAARRALAIVQSEPERRRHLQKLADLLRARLREAGLASQGSQCQIVPVIVGEPAAAVELSRQLEAEGLLVPAIRPPSVPPGTSRLRISLTAGHSEEDVARLIEALKRHRPVGAVSR